MKLLQAALQRQDYDLAAHILVFALVKAKAAAGHHKSHDSKSSKKQSKG